jgi:hypothetical protein
MSVEEIIKIEVSRLVRIRVRSALNPILFLSLEALVFFLPAAWFFRDSPPIQYFLIAVAVLPSIGAIVAYVILLFRSPDRLRNPRISV